MLILSTRNLKVMTSRFGEGRLLSGVRLNLVHIASAGLGCMLYVLLSYHHLTLLFVWFSSTADNVWPTYHLSGPMLALISL